MDNFLPTTVRIVEENSLVNLFSGEIEQLAIFQKKKKTQSQELLPQENGRPLRPQRTPRVGGQTPQGFVRHSRCSTTVATTTHRHVEHFWLSESYLYVVFQVDDHNMTSVMDAGHIYNAASNTWLQTVKALTGVEGCPKVVCFGFSTKKWHVVVTTQP